MKPVSVRQILLPWAAAVLVSTMVCQQSAAFPARFAGGRGRAGGEVRGASNFGGGFDHRGVVNDRRAIDNRGVFDPRNPPRRMSQLPVGYSIYRVGDVNFYYCGGSYYCPYYYNGEIVYVLAPVSADGVPMIPEFQY
jgi:hypothetical protein